jgi:hypothetical protein
MTSHQTDSQEARPQRPTDNDPTAWRALAGFRRSEQWRTEPEIDEERKEGLAKAPYYYARSISRQISLQGVEQYRADVEKRFSRRIGLCN